MSIILLNTLALRALVKDAKHLQREAPKRRDRRVRCGEKSLWRGMFKKVCQKIFIDLSVKK